MKIADIFALVKKKEEENARNGLKAGSVFPKEIYTAEGQNEDIFLVCVVSLSCSICIDLLPKINGYLNNLDRNKHHFILLLEGVGEEVISIRDHFQFDFPIIAIKALKSIGVFETPTCFLFDKENRILSSKSLHRIEELDDILG